MSATTRATWCALALAAALAWTAGPAAAQACDARQVAGYRVLTLEGARRIAVWYPAAGVEAERAYARSAQVERLTRHFRALMPWRTPRGGRVLPA